MKTASFVAVVVLSTVATVAAAAPSDAAGARQPVVAQNASATTTNAAWQAPGVRGAKAAAAKGPTALRLYIQRTRMIFGLRYEDYLQP